MDHWHECSICKEYLECRCEACHSLSVYCEECSRRLCETLLGDSLLIQVFRLPGTIN
jgi:hypothetical protein